MSPHRAPPDTRSATAPASDPLRHETDPGDGSDEHRSAWTPSDPRRGILPRGRAGWPERADQEC
jgi:hypothetical protein